MKCRLFPDLEKPQFFWIFSLAIGTVVHTHLISFTRQIREFNHKKYSLSIMIVFLASSSIYNKIGCISLLLFRLLKFPSQCYSNGPDNLGNLGSNEEIQPVHIKIILHCCFQIILLTDGSIWGENELFKIIAGGKKTCQVYAFGIGFGASTSLIRGVARAGRGKAIFLRDDNKQLKDKVSGKELYFSFHNVIVLSLFLV